MEPFDIYFSAPNDMTTYRAKVTVTYWTANVMRFTVSAGTKEMKLEKWLFRKNNQWKVTQVNFNFTLHDKKKRPGNAGYFK